MQDGMGTHARTQTPRETFQGTTGAREMCGWILGQSARTISALVTHSDELGQLVRTRIEAICSLQHLMQLIRAQSAAEIRVHLIEASLNCLAFAFRQRPHELLFDFCL